MLKNIYTKTFYERRWFLVAWAVGLFSMTLLTMIFFPYLKDSGFDEIAKSAPKSLQGLLGDTSSYATLPGYVGQQIFALRLPAMTIIMAIALFTGLSAGDENKGTQETLLAQPVSRRQVFWHKFGAGAVIMLLANIVIIFAVVTSFPVVKDSMSVVRLAEAALGCWLLTMVLGALTYGLGAATGKRGVTIGASSAVAFGSYLLTSLAPAVSNLDTAQKASVFYYYNTPSIADHGIRLGNVAVLGAIVAVALVIGLAAFVRRDLSRE
jgi:ABC-2 type transport system permease protein